MIHFSQNGDTPSVKWKGSLVSKRGGNSRQYNNYNFQTNKKQASALRRLEEYWNENKLMWMSPIKWGDIRSG